MTRRDLKRRDRRTLRMVMKQVEGELQTHRRGCSQNNAGRGWLSKYQMPGEDGGEGGRKY